MILEAASSHGDPIEQPVAILGEEDRQRGFAMPGRVLQNDGVWAVLAATVILFQLVLVVAHQPWHDEYQALLIALQSPDLPALIANLHYEGHPPLWYLILRGVAAVVPAAWVLIVVQSFVAGALQILILFRARAPRIQRLLAATSYFMLIDYGMISRSLSLGILLFTASMLMRGRRASWLAIMLMPMTDFIFGILSLVSIAVAFRDRRIWWPGPLLWAASAALAAWSVTMPADIIPAVLPHSVPIELVAWLDNLSTLLIPFPTDQWQPRWDAPLVAGDISAVAGLAFLLFADRQLVARPFERTMLHGVIVATAGLSILVFPLTARVLSVISWALLLLRWQDRTPDLAGNRLFVAWLGVGAACGAIAGLINLVTPFDFSARAATFIERHDLQREHWLAFPFPTGAGVSALTGLEFDRLRGNCLQSFSRWNYRDKIATEAELDAAVHRVEQRDGRYYLISRFPLPPSADPGDVKMLASFTGAYDWHDVFLYEIGASRPRSPIRPPRCAPLDRLPLALDRPRAGSPPTTP